MSSKNPAQRLRDILENVDAIQAFVAGVDFTQFSKDRKTVYAVTRALEIISEASRRLPDEIKKRHAELDWMAIASAGNVYRHEYEAVDEMQLWQTVQRELAGLREVVTAELARS
jgi:uncharacterized protein with HEPN domain